MDYPKNLLKIVLIFVAFLYLSNNGIAQEPVKLNTIEKFSIDSEILNEKREFSIFLPDNYKDSDDKYPVLFLLDGRTHFQHAIGATNYLAIRGIIPNLIIVSIHNIDRTRDFSPVHSERFPTSGGAENFRNFIEKELKTYLSKEYRTSEYSVLMGHSFGGTFAAYSLLTQPTLFDAYIAVSPYLQYHENYVVNLAETELKKKYKSEKAFYMTVGDEPDYFYPLKEFYSLVNEKSADYIRISYEKMETENHGTIPYISLFNGLRFVFEDWQLPQEKLKGGLATIDNHYKTLSKKYGVSQQTPEGLINVLGYRKLQLGSAEEAIEIFSENVKRYPDSANVYDSLGEAYEKNNQLDLAQENYLKACKIGEKNGDANLSVYKNNLERVQKQ